MLISNVHAELEINFDEADYSITEGDTMSPQISLQFRITESDFTLMLTPVTLMEAEEIFEVNNFINTANLSQATSGE